MQGKLAEQEKRENQQLAAINNATVTARITSPTGTVEELPVSWTVQRDGEYSVEFRPLEEGEYEVEVTAERNGEALGSDKTYLYTAPSDDEYFSASRRTQTLRRIADETGGQFYTPEDVSSLPEDIRVTGAGVTLPFLFFLLLMLMGGEWGFRRIRGLI